MRQNIGEVDIRNHTQTKAIAIFLKRIVPTSLPGPASKAPNSPRKTRRGTQTVAMATSVNTTPIIPSNSTDLKYESPKQEPIQVTEMMTPKMVTMMLTIV